MSKFGSYMIASIRFWNFNLGRAEKTWEEIGTPPNSSIRKTPTAAALEQLV
jgi:hypothetical protein